MTSLLSESFLTAASQRVADALVEAPARTPHYVTDGKWTLVSTEERSAWLPTGYDHGNWTSGFWSGMLVELELLGAEPRRGQASDIAHATAARVDDGTTHDVGFMFEPSACRLYELTGEQQWSALAERAADTLARRFRPSAGYLQAFGDLNDERGYGTSTIDTMMNLPLLWWVADRCGRDDLFEIGRRHADASLRNILRDNGSTYHLIRYSADGSVQEKGTFQGLGAESCWSRGQAWAIHGFVSAAIATQERRYFEAAHRCLTYFVERAPLERLTPYDLEVGEGHSDASALAIVASALAEATGDPSLSELLDAKRGVVAALTTLGREALFADTAGLIGRSAYSVPHGLGVNGALPYGDYYFLRALRLGRELLPT